jgi:hypothetical protein
MASLFIKDPEVARLAAEIAAREGKTKTQAVKDALMEAAERLDIGKKNAGGQDLIEWLRALHQRYPAPKRGDHGRDVYDWMSDEEEQ